MGNEYNFLGLSDKVKDTKGKEYVLSGYYNRDDKTMYWKTQGESFLYSGDGGKPRGYLDKHGKPHFHIPGSEDKMYEGRNLLIKGSIGLIVVIVLFITIPRLILQ